MCRVNCAHTSTATRAVMSGGTVTSSARIVAVCAVFVARRAVVKAGPRKTTFRETLVDIPVDGTAQRPVPRLTSTSTRDTARAPGIPGQPLAPPTRHQVYKREFTKAVDLHKIARQMQRDPYNNVDKCKQSTVSTYETFTRK